MNQVEFPPNSRLASHFLGSRISSRRLSGRASDSGIVRPAAEISAAGGSKTYDEVVVVFRREGATEIRFTAHIDAKFSDCGMKPLRLELILKTAPDILALSGDPVFEVEGDEKSP